MRQGCESCRVLTYQGLQRGKIMVFGYMLRRPVVALMALVAIGAVVLVAGSLWVAGMRHDAVTGGSVATPVRARDMGRDFRPFGLVDMAGTGEAQPSACVAAHGRTTLVVCSFTSGNGWHTEG